MLWTLKVTGNHVICHRSAWLLSVIMSNCSHTLCCLPSVKKQKHDFHFFFSFSVLIKRLLDSIFVISRIIKLSVRLISRNFPLPWPWLFWVSQELHLRVIRYCLHISQKSWTQNKAIYSAVFSSWVWVISDNITKSVFFMLTGQQ